MVPLNLGLLLLHLALNNSVLVFRLFGREEGPSLGILNAMYFACRAFYSYRSAILLAFDKLCQIGNINFIIH